MSEEIQPTEEILVEQPVEQIYIYQPTDEDNRPIGGKQVIKYHTEEELREKLKEQNVLLIRKLRQETRKNRLGVFEEETLPDDVQRFNSPAEFSPRDLTDDERLDISRKLLDPTTAPEAITQLMEARLGGPLDAVGSTMRDLQQENITMRAKLEVNAFKADNPDYYMCQDNFEAITSWMGRYDLAPVKANFQRAYDTLKAQGALILGPPIEVRQPESELPPVPVATPVVEPIVAHIPTGLTRDNSSSVGPTPELGSEITYTIGGKTYKGYEAIQVMPGEEYGRRLRTDRNFAKLVDKLEAERRKPRV